MEKGSRERAVRVADTMQLLARLIVLVIIIPTAVLLAVYFLLEPIILDDFIRVFFSGSVGIGLGGLLLIRMKRPKLGAILIAISSLLGVVSLSLLWQYTHAIAIAIHSFLLLNLISCYNLRRSDVLNETSWKILKSLLGVIVILSGVTASSLYFIALGYELTFVVFTTAATLSVYLLLSQYFLRTPQLGVPNICILSLSTGLYGNHLLIENIISPSIDLVFSFFLFSIGIGFFVSSLALRRIQLYLFERPQLEQIKKEKKRRIDDMIGIEIEQTEEEPIDEVETPVQIEPWVVDPFLAYALTGIGTSLIAAGVPFIFLWFASLTEWSSLPTFHLLMFPLGMLLGFLFFTPSPVLFRLGEKINRDTEGIIVRIIGTTIIVISSFSLFSWMQHFNWNIIYSIGASFILIISGVTGLFREIRRWWRRQWLRIVSTFRYVKLWVRTHPIGSGLFANIIFTLAIVYYLSPSLMEFPQALFVLTLIGATIFSGVGVIGLAAFRAFPKRNQFLSYSWLVFIGTITMLVYWYLSTVLAFTPIDSIRYSMLVLLCTAALLKIEVSRKLVAVPYIPGVLAALWIVWDIETASLIVFRPLLTVVFSICLCAPILRPEYTRFAIAVRDTLVAIGSRIKIVLLRIGGKIKVFLIRVGTRIKSALIRFGSAVKSVFVRIGTAIYRAVVFIGRLLVSFIFISYAVLLFGGLFFVGFNFMYLGLGYDFLLIAIVMAVLFFILYLPLLSWKGKTQTPLMLICLLGLAISSSIALFYFLDSFPIVTRILASLVVGSSILSLGKSQLPESMKQRIIIVTWISVVILISSIFYYTQTHILGSRNALLFAITFIGFGILPLKLSESLDSRIVDLVYVVCVVPAGFLLILDYFWIYEILIVGISSLIGLLVMLLPVAYDEYYRGIAWLYRKFVFAAKMIVMVIALYIVAFLGLVALSFAALLMWLAWPIFAIYSIPILPATITFLVILLLFWLPILNLRRDDNPELYSYCVLAFVFLASFDVYLLFDFGGMIESVLVMTSMIGILLTLVSSEIHFIRDRRVPGFIGLISVLLLVVYLLPVDLVTKMLILSCGFSSVGFNVLTNRSTRTALFVLLSSSLFGIVFWNLYLMGFDPIIVILEFLILESLTLNLSEYTRSWSTWYLLSFAIGGLLHIFLIPYTIAAPFFAFLVSMEMIRITPEIEYRFMEHFMILDFLRALLIGISVGLYLITIFDFLITLEISIILSLSVLVASSQNYRGPLASASLGLTLAFASSTLIFTMMHDYLGISLLAITIPASLPILIVSLLRSKMGPFKTPHWYLLATTLILDAGVIWYTLYNSVESLLLAPPSILLAFCVALQWHPEAEGERTSRVPELIGSTIIFLEAVWIWHAFYIIHFDWIFILFGIGLIPLLSIFYPLLEINVNEDFEFVWDLISIIAAITTGSYLTSWNLFSFTLPEFPILTFGAILSLYPLFAIPGFVVCERYTKLERAFHYAWSTSLPGWALLFYYYGTYTTSILYWQVALALIGFSLAGIIYALLDPEPRQTSLLVFNLTISSSVALMYWTNLSEPFADIWMNLFWTFILWYILSLPTLARPTWNCGMLCVNKMKQNIDVVATILPVFIGGLLSLNSLAFEPIVVLTLPIRHYIMALAVFLSVTGFIYLVECFNMDRVKVEHLKIPGVFMFAYGIFTGILGLGLHEQVMNLFSLVFVTSGAFSVSVFIALPLCLGLGWNEQAKTLLALVGLAMGPTALIGLTTFMAFTLPFAIVVTLVIMFILIAPVFWDQVRKILALIRNLGLLLVKAFNMLKDALKRLFEKFGYVMWAIFSIAFSVGLGIVSYPFFSELMSMPQGGLLYAVPSITIPTLILGLLFMTMAIVRRRVRSTLGSISGFLISSGAGITIAVALYEKGYWYLALFTAILAFCFLGLIIQVEAVIDEKYTSVLFVPIPISVGSIILYYLLIPAISIEAKFTAFVLATLVVVLIFLASTYFNIIPSKIRGALWIALSVNSGLAAYFSSYMAYYDEVASIYLCFFIASWILYPVTGRKQPQLFYAPLFFSLTGFAFSIFLGTTIQSLLLAIATLLYFVSRYVKEEEQTRPNLVYLRIVILITLVVCLALFGLLFSMGLMQAPT